MAQYILVLASDTPEPGRKKEGDIVVSTPWEGKPWGGKKDRTQYFFIIVDFGNTLKTLNDGRIFRVALYDDGILWHPPEPDPSMEPLWHPTAYPEDPEPMEAEQEMIGKNRYKISFATIDLLAKSKGVVIDWKRVRDEGDDYQPLLDGKVIFDYDDFIENKVTSMLLTNSDITMIKGLIETGDWNASE